jgi:hypothetical protein
MQSSNLLHDDRPECMIDFIYISMEVQGGATHIGAPAEQSVRTKPLHLAHQVGTRSGRNNSFIVIEYHQNCRCSPFRGVVRVRTQEQHQCRDGAMAPAETMETALSAL